MRMGMRDAAESARRRRNEAVKDDGAEERTKVKESDRGKRGVARREGSHA